MTSTSSHQIETREWFSDAERFEVKRDARRGAGNYVVEYDGKKVGEIYKLDRQIAGLKWAAINHNGETIHQFETLRDLKAALPWLYGKGDVEEATANADAEGEEQIAQRVKAIAREMKITKPRKPANMTPLCASCKRGDADAISYRTPADGFFTGKIYDDRHDRMVPYRGNLCSDHKQMLESDGAYLYREINYEGSQAQEATYCYLQELDAYIEALAVIERGVRDNSDSEPVAEGKVAEMKTERKTLEEVQTEAKKQIDEAVVAVAAGTMKVSEGAEVSRKVREMVAGAGFALWDMAIATYDKVFALTDLATGTEPERVLAESFVKRSAEMINTERQHEAATKTIGQLQAQVAEASKVTDKNGNVIELTPCEDGEVIYLKVNGEEIGGLMVDDDKSVSLLSATAPWSANKPSYFFAEGYMQNAYVKPQVRSSSDYFHTKWQLGTLADPTDNECWKMIAPSAKVGLKVKARGEIASFARKHGTSKGFKAFEDKYNLG